MHIPTCAMTSNLDLVTGAHTCSYGRTYSIANGTTHSSELFTPPGDPETSCALSMRWSRVCTSACGIAYLCLRAGTHCSSNSRPYACTNSISNSSTYACEHICLQKCLILFSVWPFSIWLCLWWCSGSYTCTDTRTDSSANTSTDTSSYSSFCSGKLGLHICFQPQVSLFCLEEIGLHHHDSLTRSVGFFGFNSDLIVLRTRHTSLSKTWFAKQMHHRWCWVTKLISLGRSLGIRGIWTQDVRGKR